MKHIFKVGEKGSYATRDGVKYHCKCVRSEVKLPKDWSNTLDEAIAKTKKVEKVVAEVKEPVQEEIAG